MITPMKRLLAASMLLWAGGAALSPTPARAQDRQGPPAGDRARVERQIRERFEAVVQQELGLDEATAARLRETTADLMTERRRLGARRAELQRRLRSSSSLLDETVAASVLDQVVAVQQEEVDLLVREQQALLEVLSAPQVVRLYALRERFEERVRRLRAGGEARRGGGGPDGPAFDSRHDGPDTPVRRLP